MEQFPSTPSVTEDRCLKAGTHAVSQHGCPPASRLPPPPFPPLSHTLLHPQTTTTHHLRLRPAPAPTSSQLS